MAVLTISFQNNVNNAYAYYAQAGTTQGNQSQNMASSPVQLTVGYNTTLLLCVSRQSSSNTHTFMARLVDNARNAVPNRVLMLELNDTAHEYTAKTDQNGNATWTETLSPQANDSATVYNIAVSFAGDTPVKTATAYLTTPNGTRCAICTTIQYASYKPSANSTSILVWPQTTTGVTSLKSQDQTQAYAKSKSWFSVYNEFSWWYPWYRLHVKVSISSFMVDVGFNPVLPSIPTLSWNGLNVFSALLPDTISDIGLGLLGLFAQYLIAKYAAATLNFVLALAVELLKAGAQGLLLWLNWSNRMGVLADAIISFVMGILALGDINIAESILNGVCSLVGASTSAALQWIFTTLDNVLMVASYLSRTWVDGIEVASDFVLGGVALAHYCGYI